MTFIRGLVVKDSGKVSTDGLHGGFSLCDRANVSYMLPFGVMSLPTGVYWIAQMSGWSRETYTIIDITPRSRAVNVVTPGGGC